MSEIGLNINVDSYNNEGIKTIKGNNNAEIYKLYILKNKRRLSLVGKTVKLGYVMVGTTNGDVIENLNITNAEQGEITFPITNRISKKDGVYSCQLAIYGADGFLEHTATFGLTVEANIFTKIAGEIADSKDFTYLENILDKASKLSEKLKENTSTATNANSNLESNIIEANNINSKLLENTSTATSLNKNLESNIDLAKEVKETIKDLDTKNIEATSNIGQLTGLNAKATELSNNIQQGLPLNSELIKNTESAKTANNELIATNNDAKAKKTDLDNSLEEAKKYISGLDGSKNPVQMQLDINELKNGLKSNQSLSYEGSSIAANNTLEGRTEGMRIVGRTLVNLKGNVKNRVSTWVDNDDKYTLNLESGHGQPSILYNLTQTLKENQKYTVIVNLIEYTSGALHFSFMNSEGNKPASTELVAQSKGLKKFVFTINNTIKAETLRLLPRNGINNIYSISKNILILEGDWTNKEIPSYFEGLKSFGEAEKVEDKYKISILSNSKNLFNVEESKKISSNTIFKEDGTVEFEQNEHRFYIKNGEFKKNTQYTLTFEKIEGSCLFGINYIDGTSQATSGENIITSMPNKTIKSIRSADIGGGKSSVKKVQLEEGVRSTAYEPYKCNKKDILIKEPLRSVGDVKDIMYEDNGKVKIDRKCIMINVENKEIIPHGSANDREFKVNFKIDISDIPIYSNNKIICNNFKNITSTEEYEDNKIEGVTLFSENRNNIYVSILKSKLTTPDVEGFKAWLKANPTTIVYQLATPTVEIVENCVDIDLDTFGEKTYFNILNSLPGTLDFKVPSNLGSSLQNLAKEVNNIWDVINNLLVPGILDVNKKVALATIKNNLK